MLQKLLEPGLAKLTIVDDSADAPGGYIEGYASVFGNTDLGGDVVEKGAFSKTLRERLKKGAIKLVDSHRVHEGTAAVIGVLVDAKEDDYGLWFRAKLSMVSRAQEIRTKVKEGVLNALSFGYDIVKAARDPKAGVQLLKELKLYEVSVVIWGMNPLAEVNSVKGLIERQPFKFAPRDTQWDAAGALERMKAWVSPSPEVEWTEVDQAKFSRSFLWSKEDSRQFLVADIIDEEPHYVLGAVKDALVQLRSASESAEWFSEIAALEDQVKGLYEQFNESFPVKGHAITPEQELLPTLSAVAKQLSLSRLLQDMTDAASAMKQAR